MKENNLLKDRAWIEIDLDNLVNNISEIKNDSIDEIVLVESVVEEQKKILEDQFIPLDESKDDSDNVIDQFNFDPKK